MLHNIKIQRLRSKKQHATAHLDAFLHRMRTNNTVLWIWICDKDRHER